MGDVNPGGEWARNGGERESRGEGNWGLNPGSGLTRGPTSRALRALGRAASGREPVRPRARRPDEIFKNARLGSQVGTNQHGR